MAVTSGGERFDIIISGASFAGQAFALALAAALGPDVRLAILDRSRPGGGAGPDSRAFAISAGSKRMLETLGVWHAVAAAAQPVHSIEITDSSLDSGIRPALLTYDNAVSDGAPAAFIVPNTILMAALAQAVAARAEIMPLQPAQAIDMRSTEDGAEVAMAGGVSLRAALVVAADGRRSALREAAGIKIVGWTYPQTGIVTTVAHDRPHHGRAVQHFLPAGPFAILPLIGDRSCITWTEAEAPARTILALDDAAFLAEVDRRFGGKLGRLRLDGPRQSWPLETHLARRYIGRRLALVGDAAHTVHPIAGQGLNLALRDVAALAECVVEAARLGLDLGDGEALARYERWRRFDSTLSAAAYDGLNRLFASDWALLRSAREFGLGVVERWPGLKRLLVEEAAGLTGETPRLLKGEAL